MKYIQVPDNVLRTITLIQKRTWACLDLKYKKFEISGPKHVYITAVCRNPGIVQNELCDPLNVDKSNVARNVDYLVKKGFIEQKKAEDNFKIKRLYPTQKALDAYSEICDIFNELTNNLFEGFTEEERVLFISLLSRIEENTRTMMDNIEQL